MLLQVSGSQLAICVFVCVCGCVGREWVCICASMEEADVGMGEMS